MKSKAIFIGTNGSLGFVTGKEYDLHIFTRNGYIWIQDGLTPCPYATMRALLKNWQFVY